MICSASDFSSSGFSGAMSSPIRSPFTRTVAGRPTLSSRSEAPRWTICVMACLKLNDGPVCGASGMRIHPKERLSELDGLGVLHQDLADQPRDLGLDLVHDLHGFDDAHHLPRGDAAPHLRVGLRPRLGSGVERPHHGRLDLHQVARERRGNGGAEGAGGGGAGGGGGGGGGPDGDGTGAAGPAPSPETGPTPACWPPVFDTCPTLVTRIDDQLPNSPRRTSIAPNSGASFKICTSRAMMSRFMSPRSAPIVENLHEFQEVRPA